MTAFCDPTSKSNKSEAVEMMKTIVPLANLLLKNPFTPCVLSVSYWKVKSKTPSNSIENDCGPAEKTEEILKTLCSETAQSIEFRNKFKISKSVTKLKRSIDLLVSNGVSAAMIYDNPWLLNKSKLTAAPAVAVTSEINAIILRLFYAETLRQNIELVQKMKPTDFNHFVPLLDLSPRILFGCLKQDEAASFELAGYNNRFEYFSERLQVGSATFEEENFLVDMF